MAIKSRAKMRNDLIVLIIIIIAIYYLKMQITGETYNPASGAMSLLGIGE